MASCGCSSPSATLPTSSRSAPMPGAPGISRNELSRLCMDALRAADGALLTTDAVTGRIIEAKGFDAADAVLRKAIGEPCLAVLRSFKKQGTVAQVGLG